jgi:four helix bundle protein
MARDHRKLEAFKLADALVLDIYRATVEFPVAERYGLQSQLRRAAVSTPTNIVEGCAREPEGDFLRFLDIAFASSRELLYLLNVAHRLSFLPENDVVRLSKTGERVAGALMNLRRSIRPGSRSS